METARSRSKSPPDDVPSSKRQKAPTGSIASMEEEGLKGKVCIIYSCDTVETSYIGVLIVDPPRGSEALYANDFPIRRPVLQFDSEIFGGHAFCVLKEALYTFEGDWNGNENDPNATAVHKIDLKPSLSLDRYCGKLLEMGDLDKVGHMRSHKSSPAATSTPDGEKIIVFSLVSHRNRLSSTLEFSFEVYDPNRKNEDDVWEEIPLQIKHGGSDRIQGYTFVDQSTFLVVTTLHGLFSLDLASFKWTPVDNSSGVYAGLPHLSYINSYDYRFFVIENKKLCVGGWGASSVGGAPINGQTMVPFPPPTLCPLITPVNEAAGGNCSFCLAKFDEDCNNLPFLMLDVCSLDLDNFNKTGKLEISLTGRSEFLLDDEQSEGICGLDMYFL